jgi:predicted DNA binding CopG/RHH family protein
LAKEGISLNSLQHYQHWRRGYGGSDIGRYFWISAEEAEASISHIQKVIPGEMFARDMDLRNEIIESENRFEKTRQRFHESLTRSVDSYLETGENPIKALQAYREFINADTSDEIHGLRKRDANIGRDGNNDHSPEKGSQPMPPLQGEETNADIQYIKALLQDEPAASNIRERDGASAKNPQIAPETPSYGFSILAETLLGWRRKNPVEIQPLCRETLECEAPSNLISDLRKRDGNRNLAAEEDGLAEEQELQLIEALRHEDEAPAKATTTEEYVNHAPAWIAPIGIDELKNAFNRPDKNQRPSKPIAAEHERKGSKRITIRVSDELHNRIQGTAQALGVDLSTIVRELIERSLESGSDTDAKTTAASLSILPEAFQYSAPYRAWCGDLRAEFRQRFLSLVAIAHESVQRWPKTPWVRELFLALLPLQKHLEDGSVRHD